MTGQAGFCILALGGKAVFLRQSYRRLGVGLCNWRKESESARENPVLLCGCSRKAVQAWKTDQLSRHSVGRESCILHLHSSICLKLGEISTSLRISSMNII